MWKIRITDGPNITEMLLPTEPLPTWPMGKVADFSAIGALATRSFRVPSTPETDTFFEGLGNFDYDGNILFREQSLTLLYNEQPVLENAIIAEFRELGGEYEIVLSSDNAILKNKLGAKLTALDTSAINLLYFDGEAVNLLDEDLRYHVAHFSATDTTLIPDYFKLPSVRLSWLFEQIFAQNGLNTRNLSTVDIFSENDIFDEFRDMFLQLTTINPPWVGTEGEGSILAANTPYPPVYTAGGGFFSGNFLLRFEPFFNGFFTTDDPSFLPTTGGPCAIATLYNCDVLLNMDFGFSFAGITSGVQILTSSVTVYTNAGAVKEFYDITAMVTGGTPTGVGFIDGELSIPALGVGEYVVAKVNFDSFYEPTNIALSGLSTVKFTNTDLRRGGTTFYPTAQNLPDITQLELLQFVANYFAILVDFETHTNTVVFYNFDGLNEKLEAGNVIDLSQYAANASKAQIERYSDFGQTNYYRYNNDDKMSVEAGNGTFTTSQPRPATVDIYNAPFSYSNFLGTDRPNLAIFPYIEVSDAAAISIPDKYGYTDMKVRVFRSELKDNPLKIEYWARIVQVDWQRALLFFHEKSIDTAQNFKILTIDCDIPYNIVQKLTDKTEKLPIYLNFERNGRKIEGFFKLNKIDRWSDKKTCKIELQLITQTNQLAQQGAILLENGFYVLNENGNKILL